MIFKKIFLMAWFFAPFLSCAGYEEPDYKILEQEGEVEIREYDSLIVAEARGVGENSEKTRDDNFRALFKYITGANEQNQEIKMTVPVFQSQLAENEWSMSFVAPKKWEWETLPQPTNKKILLKRLESQQMAALAFTGRGTDRRFSKYQALLEDYLKKKKKPYNKEKAIYAFYSPPWIPWFMRKHEVLFVIEGGNQTQSPSENQSAAPDESQTQTESE